MTSDRQRITSGTKSAIRDLVLAVACAAIMVPPLSAEAADLVVWWEKGFYPQEDEAVAEIIAAFEQKIIKQVELLRPAQHELFDRAQAALVAGQPPDFLFGTTGSIWVGQWAYEGRLVDLQKVLGPVLDLFDADVVDASTLLNGSTGQRGLYALPMGRMSNHIHVWNSILERAGFTLTEIPKEWDAFWSFWCDQVQPVLRRALGRDDVWGIGLPMSAAAGDTDDEFFQFQLAYEAPWLGTDRRPQIDDPAVRAGIAEALDAYTKIWRNGCTPPDAVTWTNPDNNKAFLAQTVVMTPNPSLSIAAALKRERLEDYYENAATIDWPNRANGRPGVEVLSAELVQRDGRPVYALKVMNPPGDYNGAMMVRTLLVDGATGGLLGEVLDAPRTASTWGRQPNRAADLDGSGLEARRRIYR